MDLKLNDKNNETVDEIIVICTSTIIFFLGIFNLLFLGKYKKQIPFSNISPNYLICTIIGKEYFY